VQLEIAVLAVAVGFLLLVALGTLREVVFLRAGVNRCDQLIARSRKPPSFVSEKVPDVLVEALASRRTPNGTGRTTRPARELVAFVAPGCRPCETLVQRASLMSTGFEQLVFVVVAAHSANGDTAFAAKLPGRVIVDETGRLATACEIQATPTLFLIDKDDHHLVDYTYAGDVEWIANHLNQPSLTVVTPR